MPHKTKASVWMHKWRV